MKKRKYAWFALLLSVMLLFTFSANAFAEPLTFSTKTLNGQAAIDSSIMKNYTMTMINLWAEWCGPCMGELPDLEKIHKDYPDMLLLGAWVSGDKKSAINAAADAGVTYTLIEMPHQLFNFIQIEGGSYSIPQTCFFDRDGNLLNESFVGSRSYSSWADIVQQMLSKVPASDKPSFITVDGWNLYNGAWYYWNGTDLEKGWKTIDGVWYFFDRESGAMKTGWLNDGGAWYYLNTSGAMVTGWVADSGNWYFLNTGGAMYSGWLKYGDAWYLLKTDGAMATGWFSDGSVWYFFDVSGAMAVGWRNINGTWYYFDASGAMKTGWLQNGGTWYYFDVSGAMATGWKEINGQWEFFSENGAWLYSYDGN